MLMRTPSTTRSGSGFTPLQIQAVWQKAQMVSGYDPAVYRKDCCGAWIKRSEYGQRTQNGWEIDHIQPVAANGSDDLSNLQPLQWQNNRHKGDSWPSWSCAVKAA